MAGTPRLGRSPASVSDSVERLDTSSSAPPMPPHGPRLYWVMVSSQTGFGGAFAITPRQ
ncbi:hypothetical protein [Streptomyces sp. H27-D2]|uniref:hypothetical protein n=1 Tax=Streptomyces sp. H27-D2 TaxID=3046304 RepID=UPI002DB98EB5|nr:hypothetical protein [Streptomyces sp. H27-D2]MEC4018506.1 hypothetical protein [Streptomyces sp. H27-D2]